MQIYFGLFKTNFLNNMIWYYAKSQTLHHLLEVMIFSSPLGYKQSFAHSGVFQFAIFRALLMKKS